MSVADVVAVAGTGWRSGGGNSGRGGGGLWGTGGRRAARCGSTSCGDDDEDDSFLACAEPELDTDVSIGLVTIKNNG